MKKSLILGVFGLVAAATSSFGAPGYILMDNYNTSGPNVTYGPGGAGVAGTGLLAGWTAGIYYAAGNVLSQVANDPTGFADPSGLGGGLALATGPGSMAAFDAYPSYYPGQFLASTALNVGGNAGDTLTAMIVAYNGSSYLNSFARGHSAAFIMTSSPVLSPTPHAVGNYMTGFSVPVPEPTTLALAGLGGLSVLFFRRKTALNCSLTSLSGGGFSPCSNLTGFQSCGNSLLRNHGASESLGEVGSFTGSNLDFVVPLPCLLSIQTH